MENRIPNIGSSRVTERERQIAENLSRADLWRQYAVIVKESDREDAHDEAKRAFGYSANYLMAAIDLVEEGKFVRKPVSP